MSISTTPGATARIQFFEGFTLDDGAKIVPYLAKLGITHLYASPLLKARPGSTHCYDIVSHDEVNPELGGEPALKRLVAVLRQHGMGLLLDIVPNHMGVGGADNGWWMDVLEWGRASRYAEFFDIDFEPPNPLLRGKILAPFLGSSYGETLANGEFVLKLNEAMGQLYIEYHEHHFPISVRSISVILFNDAVLKPVSAAMAQAAKLAGRHSAYDAAAKAKTMLKEAYGTADGKAALDAVLERYNAEGAEAQRRMHELLTRQNYVLAWWRAATDEINWRRFFDINTLAGMRVEIPRVFDATHRYVLKLYAEGLIDGVRIDHVDGLADPRGYCRKLRRRMEVAGESRPADAAQGPPYIVIEKILAGREKLIANWETDGTTGYDFMDQVSAMLHDPAGEAPLTALWSNVTGRSPAFEQEEQAARRQILRDNLASELSGTAAALHRIGQRDLTTRDFTLTSIRRAVAEILTYFPVYRVYAGQAGHSDTDEQLMDRAMAGARRTFRAADRPLLDVVRRWLIDDAPRTEKAGPRRTERLRAMVRFQQLSAPTAAKSVEDTAFYRYGRLISRNEVGSSPGQFSLSTAAFHAIGQERAKRMPGALLATATHDHKRGEDTRARLAVLSELPAEWETAITRWTRLNAIIRRETPAGPSPSAADELMLYQTLVAAWPLELEPDDAAGVEAFTTRVFGWLTKAMREAKLVSEWAEPNGAYESASEDFLHGVLDPSRPVLAEIVAFARRIGPAGAINGLAQTVIRHSFPGVPDLYQGSDFWDQSLVDPDNRRPVDYPRREAALEQGLAPAALLANWTDGRIKQAIIVRLLALRQARVKLFRQGDYTKLEAEGPAAAHILAYARRYKGETVVTAVTRLAAGMAGELPLIPAQAWEDTRLALPEGAAWEDVLDGRRIGGGTIEAKTLFEALPVAVLASA